MDEIKQPPPLSPVKPPYKGRRRKGGAESQRDREKEDKQEIGKTRPDEEDRDPGHIDEYA